MRKYAQTSYQVGHDGGVHEVGLGVGPEGVLEAAGRLSRLRVVAVACTQRDREHM